MVTNNEIILTNDGSHSVYNKELNEIYHSKNGAIIEANHVYIKNGLLFHKKKELNILEIGLGTGLNAILTIENLEEKKVHYTALEPKPIQKEIYTKLNYCNFIVSNKKLFLSLHDSKWDEEKLIIENFMFCKRKDSIQEYTTEKKFDIIYFDAFAPNKQIDIWKINIFRKCFSIMNYNSLLVTYCAKGMVKRMLKSVGFEVETLEGPPGKREMIRAIKI